MGEPRTGVDVNGVWDGSLIDQAARWLEERNGYPEVHAMFCLTCKDCGAPRDLNSRRPYCAPCRKTRQVIESRRWRARKKAHR